MEHVELDEKARARILQNIEEAAGNRPMPGRHSALDTDHRDPENRKAPFRKQ